MQITSHPTEYGNWTFRSTSPAHLASIPERVLRAINRPQDLSGSWSLHHDEQDSTAEAAYQHEKQELGQFAEVMVYEVVRPRRANVVWVDRYHLLALGYPQPKITRLLGLYLGNHGSIMAFTYDPSVAGIISQFMTSIPQERDKVWNDPQFKSNLSSIFYRDERDPTAVHVFVAPPHIQSVTAALSS